MYSQISQLYRSDDPTSASVIADDYLNSNSYKEIIDSIEKIRNKNLNGIDFLLFNCLKLHNKKKSSKKNFKD